MKKPISKPVRMTQGSKRQFSRQRKQDRASASLQAGKNAAPANENVSAAPDADLLSEAELALDARAKAE